MLCHAFVVAPYELTYGSIIHHEVPGSPFIYVQQFPIR